LLRSCEGILVKFFCFVCFNTYRRITQDRSMPQFEFVELPGELQLAVVACVAVEDAPSLRRTSSTCLRLTTICFQHPEQQLLRGRSTKHCAAAVVGLARSGHLERLARLLLHASFPSAAGFEEYDFSEHVAEACLAMTEALGTTSGILAGMRCVQWLRIVMPAFDPAHGGLLSQWYCGLVPFWNEVLVVCAGRRAPVLRGEELTLGLLLRCATQCEGDARDCIDSSPDLWAIACTRQLLTGACDRYPVLTAELLRAFASLSRAVRACRRDRQGLACNEIESTLRSAANRAIFRLERRL